MPASQQIAFEPALAQVQFPQLKDKFVLTLPGRLTRLKGHHDFIDLVARLKREGVSVHGLIVGGEDPKRKAYAWALRERVIAEALSDTITFTGQRDAMRDIYAVSNLVLSLSSKPESFGRTVLEALSLGVPVVGYEHGGVGEILRALFPAGAVQLGDLEGIVVRVADWRSNPPHVPPQAVFTLPKMLGDTLEIYTNMVGDAGSAPH